jgi:RecA/RadA recombinase
MERIDLGAPPSSGMTLMVYGAPGTGKSTLMAGLAKAAEDLNRSAVLIDTERGLYSAARLVGLSKALLLSATSNGDGKAVLAELQKQIAEPSGLVVVDTMSELSELLLREATGLLDTPQLQHYGTRKAMLARCVRALRDAAGAGAPAVATFQQEAKEIEGLTGHWRPSIPEKSTVDAIGQFDCVARLRIVGEHEAERLKLQAGDRYLDFRPSSQQTAKCRTAAEVFGDRDAGWHIWPVRNQKEISQLYRRMARINNGKVEK